MQELRQLYRQPVSGHRGCWNGRAEVDSPHDHQRTVLLEMGYRWIGCRTLLCRSRAGVSHPDRPQPLTTFASSRDYRGWRGLCYLRLFPPFDYQQAELWLPKLECEPTDPAFTQTLSRPSHPFAGSAGLPHSVCLLLADAGGRRGLARPGLFIAGAGRSSQCSLLDTASGALYSRPGPAFCWVPAALPKGSIYRVNC